MIIYQAIIESVLIGIICVSKINQYSSQKVPRHIKMVVFLAWQLVFQVISILTLDVYYVRIGVAGNEGKRGIIGDKIK
jgi:hypothetical protein